MKGKPIRFFFEVGTENDATGGGIAPEASSTANNGDKKGETDEGTKDDAQPGSTEETNAVSDDTTGQQPVEQTNEPGEVKTDEAQ